MCCLNQLVVLLVLSLIFINVKMQGPNKHLKPLKKLLPLYLSYASIYNNVDV